MTSEWFNLTNLYIFLIEFGFSILFLVVFSCIHYGLTRTTKMWKKVEESKLLSFWYFFIFGFVLSCITFIVSQVSSIALDAIGMPLTIIGLLYAMTVFYNRSVIVGALIPSILWVLYQYNGFIEFNYAWLSRIIVVVIIAAISFATTYIRWKKWPTFLFSCLITFILLTICIVCVSTDQIGYYLTIALVAMIVTIFYYAIIGWINRWLTKMSKLAKQGVYMDGHYLIPSVLDDYFNDFIHRKNTSQALVVSLNISTPKKELPLLLQNIYETFKTDEVLFFKSTYGTYGLILSGQKYYVKDLNKSYLGNSQYVRSKSDALCLLESKLKSLKKNGTKLNAYASIYGVHSCNLSALLQRNNYAMKHDYYEGQHNIVQIFNTNLTNQEIQDNISYATLAQKVNLNDIHVELELIQINKNNETFVCPRFYWPKKLTCDSEEILKQFEVTLANTLLRSLSVKSLELYANNISLHKYQLLLYYPIDQLNTHSWSTKNIIRKIKMFGVEPSHVVFSFNSKKMRAWPKQILSNLQSLEQQDVEYMLVDVVNLTGLGRLNPKAIILDRSIKNVSQAQRNKFNIL